MPTNMIFLLFLKLENYAVGKKNKKGKVVEEKPRPKPLDDPKMLVRAKSSKQKLSTHVDRANLNSFHQKLNKVIRSSHDALKKPPRKKRGANAAATGAGDQ